ncbi:hypothetical protein N2152v2_005212 [Parachlorella kessleri]
MDQKEMFKRIMEIQNDPNLTEAEKGKKRQELMSGKWAPKQEETTAGEGSKAEGSKNGKGKAVAEPGDTADVLGEHLKCTICHDVCDRPVTAPCQHNFCLACLQGMVNKGGKKACPTCRAPFPAKFVSNPRVNTALTFAIRMAKQGKQQAVANKPFTRIDDKDRPDEAFTTERAVRAGRANAASGRIMVNVPNDHFGPIPPEADPRGQGVRVGEWWKDRLDCRQWGAHFPHVAGIAGQSSVGAQSVVLSGGYLDDKDEGEWFLYTGSGGRDLSGNKRTNKDQSFDQKFESSNKALQVSCLKGLPVRVVRSFKEKRSAYAPSEETPVRYDGIYRIAKCWRKPGEQGFLICRYLFVRCDNEPAPWSSEEHGDQPGFVLPKEALDELKQAKGPVYSTADSPWWDWDEGKQEWGWARPAPASQKAGGGGGGAAKTARKKLSEQEKALREFTCGLCKGVLGEPVSTPCGHHFCKPCLDKKFAGIADEVDAAAATGRSLRADIMEFLRTAQVNRGMVAVVEKLQADMEAARKEAAKEAAQQEGEEEEGVEGEQQEEQEAQAADGEAAGMEEDGVQPEQQEAAAGPAAAQAAAEAAPAAAAAAGGAEAGKDMAVADHQVDDSSAGPSQPAPAANTEAAKRAAILSQLGSEFPEFDAGLVEALLEQEDGDAAAVRYALRKMRNSEQVADKKRKRQAKLEEQKQAQQQQKGQTVDGSEDAQEAVEGEEAAAGEKDEGVEKKESAPKGKGKGRAAKRAKL